MAAPLKSCSVEGCNAVVIARGWCSAHYRRWKRHGNPVGGKLDNGEARRWLVSHASFEGDDCLTYPFLINDYGYGYLKSLGRPGVELASRVMCTLAHGDPPEADSYACHSCFKGNEGCVNPRHLYWGDNRSNQMDRVPNGNSNRGSRHGMSVLKEDDVRKIRTDAAVKSRRALAAQYGVSVSAIHLIMQRRTWAWLT